MMGKGWNSHKGDKLALARGYVKQYAPYMGPTLYGFVPTPVEGLSSKVGGPLAVTDRLVLLYEPEWVESVSMPQLATGLAHEICHDQLRHVARGKLYLDKKRWVKAADLFINGMLATQRKRVKQGKDSGFADVPMWDFPAWALMPKQFGFPDGLTADEYYRLLAKHEEENPDPPGECKIMCGGCGGVAGNALGDLEVEFNKIKGRTESDCKNIARSTSKLIKAQMGGNLGRGTLTGQWSEFFDIGEETYFVPWRQKLANIARGSFANIRLGGMDYSMRRPSPRSLLRGVLLPSLISYDPELAFIVDTSGSMGKAQIGDALRVISDVMTQLGIRSAWFMEADAGVQRAPVKKTPYELRNIELNGRGGTNFAPALTYMRTFKPKVSLVFYLTDGDGQAMAEPPPEFHTVWCVVPSQWGRVPAKWGTLVILSDEQEARLSPAIAGSDDD